MTVGIILVLGILVTGIIIGHRNHEYISANRPKKSSWKQGHRLKMVRVDTSQPRSRRRQRRERIVPVYPTQDDLDEMAGMFGDTGDRPEDYD